MFILLKKNLNNVIMLIEILIFQQQNIYGLCITCIYIIYTHIDNYKYTENPFFFLKRIKNEERIAYFVVQITKLVGDCESLKATGCSQTVAVLACVCLCPSVYKS